MPIDGCDGRPPAPRRHADPGHHAAAWQPARVTDTLLSSDAPACT
jgi:hypothetical protein